MVFATILCAWSVYAELRPVADAGCRISEIYYYDLGGGGGETNFVVITEWF